MEITSMEITSDYSRVGNTQRNIRQVDLNIVVKSILDSLDPSIKEHSAEIMVGILPTLAADPTQMQQLFQNLITNATKFRKNGPPKVVISAKAEGDFSLFSVRDDGIGVTQSQAHKIFLIFQGLHSVDKYPGTGIGLAICKRIVERHCGKIWLDADYADGANFLFTLPNA